MIPRLPRHTPLAAHSRCLLGRGDALSLPDGLTLALCGVAAALFSLTDWDVLKGLPGHAILRAVPPLGLGLMLVPRRGSGTCMGLAACFTAGLYTSWNGPGGAGSLTSLVVLGPLLDVALLPVQRGRGAYFALATAGVLANLSALIAQGIVKYHWPRGRQTWDVWLLTAGWTYPLFGLIAGLLVAAICFRWDDRDSSRPSP